MKRIKQLMLVLIILVLLSFTAHAECPLDCTGQEASSNFDSWDAQQQTDWLSNPENWNNPEFIRFAEQRLGPMETFNGEDVEIAEGYLEKVDYSENNKAKDIGDKFFSQGSNINDVNPLVAERFFEAKWNAPFDFMNAGTLVYNKVSGFLTNDKMTINLNEYQKVSGRNNDLTKIEAVNGGFCIQTAQSSCVKSKISAEAKYNSKTGELVVKIDGNDNTFTPPTTNREALDVDIAADGTFRVLGKADGKVVVGNTHYTFTNREGTLLIKPNGNFDIDNAELFSPNLYVDGQAEKVGNEVKLWDYGGGGTHGTKTVVIYTANPENVGIISQGQSKQHGGTVTLHLDKLWSNSQFKNAVDPQTQNSEQKRQEAANLREASNDLDRNAEVYISYNKDGELVVSSLGKVQVGLYGGGFPGGFQRLTSQPTCIGTGGSAECELKFGQQYQVYLRGETQYGDEQYGQLVKDGTSKEWKLQGGGGIQTLQKGASLSLKRTIPAGINPEKNNDDLIVFKCFDCAVGKVANVGKNIVVGNDLGLGLVNQLRTYTYQMDVVADNSGKLIISPNPQAFNKIADSLSGTSGIVLGNDVLIEAIATDGTKSTRGISRKDRNVLGYTHDSSGKQSWDSTGLRSTIGNSLIIVSENNRKSTETFLALYAAGKVDAAFKIVFESDSRLRAHLLREIGIDIHQLNNPKYLDKRNDLDDFRRQLADKGILLGVAGNCENPACHDALKNAGKTKNANAFLLTATTIRALELKNIELESQDEELRSQGKTDPKLTSQIKDNKRSIEGIRAARSKWQVDATTDAAAREAAFAEGLQAEQRQAEEVASREELWVDQQKAKDLGEIQDANQKSIEFLKSKKIELERKLDLLKVRTFGKTVLDAERDVRKVENDIADLEHSQQEFNVEVHQTAYKYFDEDPAVAAEIFIAGGDHQTGREIVREALEKNQIDIDGGRLLIINSLLAESKQKGGDTDLLREAGKERGLVASIDLVGEPIIVGDRGQIVRDADLAIARHTLWQAEEQSRIDATAEAEAYTKVIEEKELSVWSGIVNLLAEGAGETVQAIAATSDILTESPIPGAPASILRTGVRFDDPSYIEMREDEGKANYEESYRRKVASQILVGKLRANVQKLERREITLEEALEISESTEITSEEGPSLGRAYASSSFFQELKSNALGNYPNPELTANRKLEEVRAFINERSGRAFEGREKLQEIVNQYPDTRAGQTAKATLDDLDKRIGLFTVETLDKHGDLAIEATGDITTFFPFVSVLKIGGLAVKGTSAGIETISATVKATKAMQAIKTTTEVAQATKAGQFATQVGRGVVDVGQFVAEGTGKVVGGTFKVLDKAVEGKKTRLFRDNIGDVSQQLTKDKEALTTAKASGNTEQIASLEQQIVRAEKYQSDLREVQAASKISINSLFKERYIIRTKVMDDADVVVQATAKEVKEGITRTALKSPDETAKLAEIAREANRNQRILNGEIWDQRIIRKFQAAEDGARRIGNNVRAANLAADTNNLRIQNEEIKSLGGQVIYVQEDGALILDAVKVAPKNSKLVQQHFQSIEENLRNNGFQIKSVRQESDNVVVDISEVTALDAGRAAKQVLKEQKARQIPAGDTIPVIQETAESAVAKGAALEEKVDAAITGIPAKKVEEIIPKTGINDLNPLSSTESPAIKISEMPSSRVLSSERAEVLSPHISNVIGETSKEIPISGAPVLTADTIKSIFQAENSQLAGKTETEIEHFFYDQYSKKTTSGEVSETKYNAFEKSAALRQAVNDELNRDAIHLDFGIIQSGWLGLQSIEELPHGNRVRLYLNARSAESSQQAMKEIARELADREILFKIKSSRKEAGFALRTDNTVLYIDASNKPEVEKILARLNPALLDSETPLFTSRIKDGISWAEDPGNLLLREGVPLKVVRSSTPSFGETRARALSEIYKQTNGPADPNFDAIARRVFEENGIDPNQPWLSVGSKLKTEKVVAEDLPETPSLSSSCVSCAVVGGAFSTGLGGASCCTRQEPLVRLQPGESTKLDLESRISEVSPSTQDFMKENGFTGKVTKPQFSPRIAAPKSLDEIIRKNYPESVVGDLGLFQASLMERSRIVIDPTTKQSMTETSDWYVKIIKGRRSSVDIDELDRRFIMGDNVRRDQSARFILQDPEFAKYTIVPEEEILITPDNINLHASKAIEGYEVLGKKIDLRKLDSIIRTLDPNQRAELIESLDFQAAFNVWARATDVELGIANGKVIRVDDEFTFTSFDVLPTKYDPPQKYSKPDNLLKLYGNDLVLGPIDKNEFTTIKNGQEIINEEFFERRFGKHIDALTSFSTERFNSLRSHLQRAGYNNLEVDLIINRLQQMTPENMRSDIKKLILNDGYLIVREDGELLSRGEFNQYKLGQAQPENAPSPVQAAKAGSDDIMAGPNPLDSSELLRQAVLKSPEEVPSAIRIESIKTPGERPVAKEKSLLKKMYEAIAFWRSEAE